MYFTPTVKYLNEYVRKKMMKDKLVSDEKVY